MSIKNKVNFKKGWPSPTIVEIVANPASAVTTLQAGMIGHLDDSGNWVLGMTASGGTLPNATAFIFHNDQADGDAGVASADPLTSNPARYGGVHGISLQQPLIVETSQIASNFDPVIGDKLASTGGTLIAHTGSNRVVGYVTERRHTYNGLTYITFAPELGTVFA